MSYTIRINDDMMRDHTFLGKIDQNGVEEPGAFNYMVGAVQQILASGRGKSFRITIFGGEPTFSHSMVNLDVASDGSYTVSKVPFIPELSSSLALALLPGSPSEPVSGAAMKSDKIELPAPPAPTAMPKISTNGHAKHGGASHHPDAGMKK
jgi:hypothetical protein